MMPPRDASTPEPSRLLTIPEVVELTHLAPATIYRLCQRGELVAVKIGKSRRIPARCLEAFVTERIEAATASLPQPRHAPMHVPARRPRRKGAA